jgi:hypothetical protein
LYLSPARVGTSPIFSGVRGRLELHEATRADFYKR